MMGELTLLPETEWAPRLPGWVLCQITSGTGYWLHPQLNYELANGSVILFSARCGGSIRASQVGGARLLFFNVEPKRLTGLVTLGEQLYFETAAVRDKFQIFPAHSVIAVKMQGLAVQPNQKGCLFRLHLVELFLEVFGNKLNPEASRPGSTADARERLSTFLKQTPESDLLHVDFTELVQIVRCTQRHLSRIFHELVGMSFRDKHAELRLIKARELLEETDSKIVDVALESGFQSLSLFNLMFKRRFGNSPGQWRQMQRSNKITKLRPAIRQNRVSVLRMISV